MAMLRYIDAIVGLPSILFDTDVERRNLYGKAGCFRLQKYGFEYRTLSSYWLDNPSRLKFIWLQVMYALFCFERGKDIPSPTEVRDAINHNDVDIAKVLIGAYDLIHPHNVKPE